MRKRYITKVLSCEGYDFIHKIFKVDKLWRQISAPALIGFLPLNHSRYMYIKWIKLINDMQQFIDVLWKWFGDLQPGTIDTSKFHLDNTKIAGIIEEATYVQHTRGKVHKVIISSYIGEQLILQCNYLDVCFIIIYNFHNSMSEFNEKINAIKITYKELIEKIDFQYEDDASTYFKARWDLSRSRGEHKFSLFE